MNVSKITTAVFVILMLGSSLAACAAPSQDQRRAEAQTVLEEAGYRDIEYSRQDSPLMSDGMIFAVKLGECEHLEFRVYPNGSYGPYMFGDVLMDMLRADMQFKGRTFEEALTHWCNAPAG